MKATMAANFFLTQEAVDPGPYLAETVAQEINPGLFTVMLSIGGLCVLLGIITAIFVGDIMPAFMGCMMAGFVVILGIMISSSFLDSWESTHAEGLSNHYGIEVTEGDLRDKSVGNLTTSDKPSYVLLGASEETLKGSVGRNSETGEYTVTTYRNPDQLYLFVDGKVLELMTQTSDGKYIPYIPGG